MARRFARLFFSQNIWIVQTFLVQTANSQQLDAHQGKQVHDGRLCSCQSSVATHKCAHKQKRENQLFQ